MKERYANTYRKRKRLKIYQRDKFTCRYCGLDMRQNFEDYVEGKIPHTEIIITLDHIIPRRKRTKPAALERVARDWSPSNLVTACKPCNEKKGNTILSLTPSIDPLNKNK